MKSRFALVGIIAFGFAVAGCETPASEEASEDLGVEHAEEADDGHAGEYAEHEAAVDAFIEIWNTRDYDMLDEVLAPDFQRIGPDQNASGIEEMKAFVKQVHETYSDFELVVDERAFGDGFAFVHWTVTGTHSGESAVPATGKSIDVAGITLWRFENGRITEEIVKYDTAEVQRQLGIAEIPHAE